jgi:hypothetical protein
MDDPEDQLRMDAMSFRKRSLSDSTRGVFGADCANVILGKFSERSIFPARDSRRVGDHFSRNPLTMLKGNRR